VFWHGCAAVAGQIECDAAPSVAARIDHDLPPENAVDDNTKDEHRRRTDADVEVADLAMRSGDRLKYAHQAQTLIRLFRLSVVVDLGVVSGCDVAR
jgi:hypothetical protein